MTGRAEGVPLMRVEYAFLCDAATEHGGKVNALGIGIDHLGVSTLPATHPRLSLVAHLRFEEAEDGADAVVPFVVKMVDADGRDVIPPVEGRFQVQAAPGRRLEGANLLVDLVNLQFTGTGPHEVQLWSEGDVIATLPIEVWRVATV
ncbi:MAG: hypothetical protein AB7G21_13380 [Dehalococcoidia bacterium]